MLDVLCGILLLSVGYLIGRHKAKNITPLELTEEQEKVEKEYQEQVEMIRNFNGRRSKPNG